MYKNLFQNSRAALLFAGMTIIGAVVMVGSPDDKGVLNKAVERFGEQADTAVEDTGAYAEPPVVAAEEEVAPIDPAAGWGSSKASVFGDYSADDAPEEDLYAPAPQPGSTAKAQPQARIPGPQPVIADSEGIPVPGPDDE